MFDLLIRRATIIEPTQTRVADVAVEAGRIVAIETEITSPARQTIDASNKVLLPGVIDAHVHFNEPGRAEWEGMESGSRALSAGGGTCFIDMPLNSTPPLVTPAAFAAKLAAAQEKSCTDFAFWGGLVPGHLDDMPALAELGVVGFKAFMSNSGIADFAHADAETLLRGMEIAARLGLPVAVHAESDEQTSQLTSAARAAGKKSARDYLDTRPIEVELAAITTAIDLARQSKCKLHIVHVSCAAGVELVTAARAAGFDVTCETCPHYLSLTDEDVVRLGAVAKCAPVIRSRVEVEKLWQKVLPTGVAGDDARAKVDTHDKQNQASPLDLLNGPIHFLGSDHSPAPLSMKQSNDFFEIWGGIAGVQTMLPLLVVDGIMQRGLSWPRLAQLLSTQPATRFQLPNKGRIAVGYDADLTLLDFDVQQPRAGAPLTAADLLYRHQLSPYLGRTLQGLVAQTFVRGVCVFGPARDETFRGRLIRPI